MTPASTNDPEHRAMAGALADAWANQGSDSDWYVPGIGIDEGDHTVRLRPGPDWRRDILVVDRVPPSMNSNKIRSHWRGFHTQKKEWQNELGLLLLEAKLPRRNLRAIAGAFMRFPVRHRRDSGNFAGLVNKALGDALVVDPHAPVEMRFIPDDDAAHYVFGGVEFEEETGPPRTRIFLYTQPRES